MGIDGITQNILMSGDRFEREKNYWLDKLQGDTAVSSFPADYEFAGLKEYKTETISHRFSDEVFEKLNKLSKGSPYGIYMILLTGVKFLLYKYTGNNDIVLGMPIFKQDDEGEYINNIIALRSGVGSNSTFKELLLETRSMLNEANEHQNIPFSKIIELLKLQSGEEGLSLFNTLVLLGSIHNKEYIKDVRAHSIFSFSAAGDYIELSLQYNTNLFRTETILQIIRHLERYFTIVLKEPSIGLSDVDILGEDKKKILFDFNNTETEYQKGMTIHELFEKQVKDAPDNVAVIFHDRQLTYMELNVKANHFALMLREMGVKQDDIIGIMTNRSLDMIIGILAVLKAGGAYLPIDPVYPRERIEYMLEDSNAGILVTHHGVADSINFKGQIVNIECDKLHCEDALNLPNINKCSNLAYVIYTSGSTGKPKGVMIEHKAVNNFITGMTEKIEFVKCKTILALTTISFDIFTFETILPLVRGLRIVIADENQQSDAKLLTDLIIKNKVDMLQTTPSRIQAILSSEEGLKGLKGLKDIMIGGEAFPIILLDKLNSLPDTRVYNMYGPTETTVWSTMKELKKTERIDIGKPIANTQAYILDKSGNPQPVGVLGELFISGDGLARGYLNREDQTKEKFIPNPFIPGERMYKTGDMARWLPDGNIEFAGRADHQVKIRGYRIEPGEIETVMLKHRLVNEAAVIARNDGNSNYLCAYFASDNNLTVQELRQHLMGELPDYMIPSYFLRIDTMPLTPNGKVNRKALPVLEGKINTGVEYIAPRNSIERKLAAIWKELLGIDNIGINDSFFELGGHSLKATSLITRINREFKVDIAFGEIFKLSSIKKLAEYIGSNNEAAYQLIARAKESAYYPVPMSLRQIFITNQQHDIGKRYNKPEVMIIEGNFDIAQFKSIFKKLADRHEILRTSFELVDGAIMQKVHENINFDIGYMESKEIILEDITYEFMQPYDLNKVPLFKVKVVKLAPEKHAILLDMHQIITDGISSNILVQEMIDLYVGKTLQELTIQYKDFVVWQNEFSKSEYMKKQEDYWLSIFSSESHVLNLPTDYPRPSIKSFEGDRIEFQLDEELADGLNRLALDTDTTMYMILLAAYNVLLLKCTGQEDIVVGSQIAGRRRLEQENMIGMFANALAMRNFPERDKTFIEFLKQVQNNALSAYENQDYQYEELVDKLQLHKDLSRNALFDTMFGLFNADSRFLQYDSLKLVRHDFVNCVAKYDTALLAFEVDGNIKFDLRYCVKLFKKETVTLFAEHFLCILRDVVKNPLRSLGDMGFLP